MALHRDRGSNSLQRGEQQSNPIQFKLLQYIHLSEIQNAVVFIIVVIKSAASFLERFMSSRIQYQPQVSLKKHQGEYKQSPVADGLKTKKLHELGKLRHPMCNFLAPETRRCSVFLPWPFCLFRWKPAIAFLALHPPTTDSAVRHLSVRRLLNDSEGMKWSGSSACRKVVPFLLREASQAARVQNQQPWKGRRLGQIIWKEDWYPTPNVLCPVFLLLL